MIICFFKHYVYIPDERNYFVLDSDCLHIIAEVYQPHHISRNGDIADNGRGKLPVLIRKQYPVILVKLVEWLRRDDIVVAGEPRRHPV